MKRKGVTWAEVRSDARERCRCCPCRHHQCSPVPPPCPPPCPPVPPPASTSSFTLYQRDRETDAPLAGAHYALYRDGQAVASAESGADGALVFYGLLPGKYLLREIQSPLGYRAEADSMTVVVADDGAVAIGGLSAEGQNIYDTALRRFAFVGRDSATGAPLAGAAFTLAGGMHAESDGTGLVDFGTLPSGIYTMEETTAPPGYRLADKAYQVTVAADGEISVDGTPIGKFSAYHTPLDSSPPPKIDVIIEGARFIFGTGIPGASVTVNFTGETTVPADVYDNRIWMARVPDEINLCAGDAVSACQMCTDALPSQSVQSMVVAQPE